MCPNPCMKRSMQCQPQCMRRSVQRVYPCACGGECNVSTFVHEEERATRLPHVHKEERATCLHVYEEERAKCPSLCMRRKVQSVYQ